MKQTFDFYGQYDKPDIILCNPNKSELYSLNVARQVSLKIRYNALSEFSFTIDYKIDDAVNPAYDFVQAKRLVKVENHGYFIIAGYSEDTSTPTPFKKVTCLSLEAELINKKVLALGGTYKFYGTITQAQIDVGIAGVSLMNYIVSLIPNWTLGNIDSDLWNIYRSFDISDSNVYNFLMTDVESACGCIFVFDTDLRTISAIKTTNATVPTDIFISKENLIESAELTEVSSEIVTAMSVFGGNDLNIRSVNPLGGNYLYNFDYYKNINWMTQGLIDALNDWEAKIAISQPTYATILTNLFTYNQQLLVLQGQLADLNAQYLALEGVQKSLIETNQTGTAQYTSTLSQMATKSGQIASKENEIINKEAQIATQQTNASAIVTALSFNNINNFSVDELSELNTFIIENTYQNKNIITTDIMTQAEIQTQAQELYNDGIEVLAKASVPRYEFSINTVNFVFLEEFASFTQQLELGSTVTINAKDDVMIESVLLEVELSFDEPTSFSLTFSNRLRLANGYFIYSDLFGEQNKASTSVNFNGLQWSDWTNGYKDDVTTFITSSLDASVNNVINASNQEITIGLNGLRGRRLLTNGTYSPKQVWLTSNTIAFTDNNWSTAKLAIGEVTLTGGGTAYGVVGEVIVGKLIAGNQLRIENTAGTFIVDSNGATLTNSVFTVQDSGNKVRVNISPVGSTFSGITIDAGITVLGNSGGGWSKNFWVDSGGNVNLLGIIQATSGSIGGIGLNTQIPGVTGKGGIYKISDPTGYYIASNGDMVWGNLSIIGNTAKFTGEIVATKLTGTLDWNNLTNVPANKVAYGGGNGYLSGSGVYGGTWGGGGGNSIDLSQSGFTTIRAGTILNLWGAGSGQLSLGSDSTLYSPNTLFLQGNRVNVYANSFYFNSAMVATQSWVTSLGFASQSWVTSQGYYNAGDSPTFGTVSVTGTYRASDGYSGGTGTITIREYGGGYMYIYVHDGLISSWT